MIEREIDKKSLRGFMAMGVLVVIMSYITEHSEKSLDDLVVINIGIALILLLTTISIGKTLREHGTYMQDPTVKRYFALGCTFSIFVAIFSILAKVYNHEPLIAFTMLASCFYALFLPFPMKLCVEATTIYEPYLELTPMEMKVLQLKSLSKGKIAQILYVEAQSKGTPRPYIIIHKDVEEAKENLNSYEISSVEKRLYEAYYTYDPRLQYIARRMGEFSYFYMQACLYLKWGEEAVDPSVVNNLNTIIKLYPREQPIILESILEELNYIDNAKSK